MKGQVALEAQETNVDLSDFRVPKIYIKGKWKEFPDYRINRDGTKVYNIKTNKYISISVTRRLFTGSFSRCLW